MKVVVKYTNTIEEFKQEKKDIEEKANLYANEHMQHSDLQEPVRAWRDVEGNICVEYENGKYWHYKQTASGLVWW